VNFSDSASLTKATNDFIYHSVNSSSHSVNGDIAIQWEWSNYLTTHRIQTRAVRRRRRAAAADRMSASRRRRFREVFTSRCTPCSYMLLDFCNAVYNESSTLTKSSKNDAGVFCNSPWYQWWVL